MTRQTVRNAYRDVCPTREQKEKMLKKILESRDSPGTERKVYRAAPSGTGRLSTVAAVLAAAAMLAVVVWFGKDYVLRGGTPNTAATVPGVQQEDAAREESLRRYETTLNKYVRAAEEGWSAETCSANEISILCAGLSADRLGFALLDLDGNGVQELIVAMDDESQSILDLYTLSGGVPVRVLSSGDSSVYFLGEGSGIENIVLESGSCTNYIFSRLNGAELIQEQILRFDTQKDPENPWFLGFDLQPVTEAEAKTVIDANPTRRIALTMLSDLQ